jgi:hypothetical protein
VLDKGERDEHTSMAVAEFLMAGFSPAVDQAHNSSSTDKKTGHCSSELKPTCQRLADMKLFLLPEYLVTSVAGRAIPKPVRSNCRDPGGHNNRPSR